MLYLSIIIFFLVLSVMLLSQDKGEGGGFMVFVFVICIPWFFSYSNHASNLAVIKEQHRVVSVYEKRIQSLTEKLNAASTGDIKTALLNADTPIAAMVNSITKMEMKIAEADEKQAQAFVSIASRQNGLMKSVTWFFDEPKK